MIKVATCEKCATEFTYEPNGRHRRRTCGSCPRRDRKPIEKACDACGATFEAQPRAITTKCRDCRLARARVTLPCGHCGKPVTRMKLEAARYESVYCGVECKGSAMLDPTKCATPPVTPPGVLAIPLTRGHFALIDEADYPLVSRYTWGAQVSRLTVYAIGQLTARATGRHVSMHRLLAGAPGLQVDHRNGLGTDNRRENLRAATISQQRMNRRKRLNTKYKFKGIFPSYNKWGARIRANGNKIELGCSFATQEDAARAYDAAARKYHGPWAALNFPMQGEQSAHSRGDPSLCQ